MDLVAISWLAVVVATIGFFALGGLWYGPLFGTLWMRATGITEQQAQASNLPLIFGATALLELLAATGLAAVIGPDATVGSGLRIGASVGLLFVATALGVQALFERRRPVLWALNGGYNLVGFAAMGAIIGAFR